MNNQFNIKGATYLAILLILFLFNIITQAQQTENVPGILEVKF